MTEPHTAEVQDLRDETVVKVTLGKKKAAPKKSKPNKKKKRMSDDELVPSGNMRMTERQQVKFLKDRTKMDSDWDWQKDDAFVDPDEIIDYHAIWERERL